MNRRNWIRVAFSLAPAEQDLLIGRLALIGFEGFQQEDTILLGFTRENAWTKSVWNQTRLLLTRFRQEHPGPAIEFTTTVVHEINWNKAWEDSIGIVEATKRMLIKPSWKKLRAKDKGKIVIHINPKMSFGTGHHETTRLSLSLLEKYVVPDSTVLDFGCGSGILAIAAAKLGAQSVLAIDNDTWAVANAKENIKKNRMVKIIRVLLGDMEKLPSRQFDLIVANIDLPTIIHSLPELLRRLKSRGRMVLSGLLESDRSRLLGELGSQNLTPLEVVRENEWIAMSLVRA